MRLGIITLKLDYSKILKTYSKLIIPRLIKNQVAFLNQTQIQKTHYTPCLFQDYPINYYA